jgi:hypothetical protein
MTDLAPGKSAFGSNAVAINDQGHILLNLINQDEFQAESYLWNGSSLIDLRIENATWMNANDMVVGNGENVPGWYWVYANGELNTSPANPLPSPWVEALATSVNNSGEIAGLCSDGNVYDPGPACVFGPDGSYVLQGSPIYGYVPILINSTGSTCGYDSGFNFAIWSSDGTEIVSLHSGDQAECHGLNDYGVAVGLSVTGGNSYAPLLYDPLNGLRNLNGLVEHNRRLPPDDVRLDAVLYAVGISNTGYIAAQCQYTGVHRTVATHACLLTPNPGTILGNSILELAKVNPDCEICRRDLVPEAKSLPKNLDGLSVEEKRRVQKTVEEIDGHLRAALDDKQISAPQAGLLLHESEMVLKAIGVGLP